MPYNVEQGWVGKKMLRYTAQAVISRNQSNAIYSYAQNQGTAIRRSTVGPMLVTDRSLASLFFIYFHWRMLQTSRYVLSHGSHVWVATGGNEIPSTETSVPRYCIGNNVSGGGLKY